MLLKRIILLSIGGIAITLLCSCTSQFNTSEDIEETTSLPVFVFDTSQNVTIIEPPIAIKQSEESPFFQLPEEDKIENGDEFILPDIILREGGIPWDELYIFKPIPILIDTPSELLKKIDSNEFMEWGFNNGFDKLRLAEKKPELIRTRLNECNNIYTFLLEFGNRFTNEEIIESLINNKDYMNMNPDFPYEVSDAQIEAILSMNEERILHAFISDFSITKGVYYYTPEWLYYHTIEDYEEAGLTPYEILRVLDLCRELQVLHDTFIDVVEYSLYHFAKMQDSNLTIIDISGYNRDMSMPLPLGETTTQTYLNKMWFNGGPIEYKMLNLEELDSFDPSFLINGIKYTFAWVYHNKIEAYMEAGITPDILLEMLPRYGELRVLREVAMIALEEKILAYVEYYNEKSN
ncbi:MAG: hypothetical protein LBC86_00245 [Oscillospiraceae bacterium]|jgi:hypothetical protein|nr:hypothetical protein [Oscillospiraceae bacterium]